MFNNGSSPTNYIGQHYYQPNLYNPNSYNPNSYNQNNSGILNNFNATNYTNNNTSNNTTLQVIAINNMDINTIQNVPVDPLKSYLFYDVSNPNEMFLKKLNNNGLISLDTYVLKSTDTLGSNSSNNSLTIDNTLNERLERIENLLSELKEGAKNESISTDVPEKNAKSESTAVSKSTGNDSRKK